MVRAVSDSYCYDQRGRRRRVTPVPYREWSWRARMIERLYRVTHGGQIRTLVVRR